jgi:hypothetical protein
MYWFRWMLESAAVLIAQHCLPLPQSLAAANLMEEL